MSKPVKPTPEETPVPASSHSLGGQEWDDAIDSWSDSLGSLDSAPLLPAEVETPTPAPLEPSHPLGGQTPSADPLAIGSQPRSIAQADDSGVVQIPNLDELSAAHEKPRTPAPSAPLLSASRDDTGVSYTEPEHTEPLADFVVDAEEVLLTEDAAEADDFDPFAGPPPADTPVSLQLPEPALPQDLDGFVVNTAWADVAVPNNGPTAAYREERLAFLADELEARQAESAPGPTLAWVAMEAARAAHAAGASESVQRLIERACEAAPDDVAPRRERLRMFSAPNQTPTARAQALAALLSDVGERAGLQRAAYSAVAQAVRAAAGQVRRADALVASSGAHAGLHLLLARTALLDDDAAVAAEALGEAGGALGGALGADLCSAGARLLELSGLSDRGTGLRAQASALAPESNAQMIATLRLAGGFSAGDGLVSAQALLPQLSDPALRGALGRWACDLADGQGDAVLGAEILESVVDGEPLESLSLADRIALLPLHLGDVVENPEGWVLGLKPAAAALFLCTTSEMIMRAERVGDALALLELALSLCPEATFAALFAERLAHAQPASDLRLRALSLWAKGDPARAGMALMEVAAQAAPLGDNEQRQAAENAVLHMLPNDGVALHFYWTALGAKQAVTALAQLEAAAGQFGVMGEGGLAAALTEIADDLRLAEVPTRAVVRAMARSSSAEETLDHPRVLALTPLEQANNPSAIAAVYRSAAMSSRQVSLRVLEAVTWMKGAGQRKQAVQFLQSRWSGGMPSATHVMLMRVMANTFDDPESAATLFEKLAATARDVDGEAFWRFRRAEALHALNRPLEAASVYRDMGATRLHLEAHVAHHRMLWASESFAALDASLRDEADGFLGVGLVEKAAQAMLKRAQVRAQSLSDLAGAAKLVGEALALAPLSAVVAAQAMLLGALQGQGTVVLAALEALAEAGDADAACLRMFVAEGQQDAPAVQRWLSTAQDGRDRLTLRQRTLVPSAPADVWQQACAVLGSRRDGDPRLLLALKLRAAEALARTKQFEEALDLLAQVTAADPQHLPALRLAARVARAAGWPARAAAPLHQAALLCKQPHHQSQLFLEAAQCQNADDGSSRQGLLEQSLRSDPGNAEAFALLRAVFESTRDGVALADLIRIRLQSSLPANQAESLRLERAMLLETSGDRAAAKAELRALLVLDPQNATALNHLVELEYRDGAYSVAAEIYLRLARLKNDPPTQAQIFRRLGRIYHKKLSDSKLAAGAYERVLKLLPTDLDALSGLSEIYNKQNDLPRAIAMTERALAAETDDKRRLTYQLRLAGLHEKNGQPQIAGNLLRRAVELAPRSLQAIGEMARHYERHKDVQARRVLLDTSLSRLHDDLRRFPGDLSALRAIVPVLRWCSRAAGSAATAQLLAALTEDPNEEREMRAWAVAPVRGRRLTPLLNPDVDEMAYPAHLPPGLRQVMRLLGPPLSKVSKPDLTAYGVTRAERLGVGEGPRTVIDVIAVDLGVRGFDVFVSQKQPFVMVVEPGDPPAIVLGNALVERGPVAVRFAAGYVLRLVATHFDLLAAPDPGAAALLMALVQRFVQLQGPVETFIDEEKVASVLPRLNRVLGRSLRTELRPYVAEMARPESLSQVAGAVEETAARVGLLACGDLAIALQVLLAARGLPLSASTLASVPLASALFDFSLSGDYELLVRSLDSIS